MSNIKQIISSHEFEETNKRFYNRQTTVGNTKKKTRKAAGVKCVIKKKLSFFSSQQL